MIPSSKSESPGAYNEHKSLLLVVVGEGPEEDGDEEVAVGDVDVGVEPPVEGGLGDEVHQGVAQLHHDHHVVRRVPPPQPSQPHLSSSHGKLAQVDQASCPQEELSRRRTPSAEPVFVKGGGAVGYIAVVMVKQQLAPDAWGCHCDTVCSYISL